MIFDKLRHLDDIHVPTDLDEGSEPECNTEDVWQIPPYMNTEGNSCVGSNGLIYNTGLTNEQPPTTICSFCGQKFTQ